MRIKPDWLEEYLKKSPAALRHEIVDRNLVLIASTRDLQSFMLHHVSIKEAFGEDLDYVRRKQKVFAGSMAPKAPKTSSSAADRKRAKERRDS